MRYTLITQIALIAISLVIIFSFIKPMFADIKESQNELFEYSEAVSKASQFNARLQELIAIRNSFSQGDVELLENFIPTEVDTLKIMKDIESIFALNSIEIVSLSVSDEVKPINSASLESDVLVKDLGIDIYYRDFAIKFNGSYEELKNVLMFSETNSSLLEVVELSFDTVADAQVASDAEASVTADEGELSFSIVFRAYGLQASSPSES